MKIVTFDISNQSFEVYTQAEWDRQIQHWREEVGEWLEDVEMDNLTDEEVVDYMYGNELFFDSFEV
jgi:hypothetical protein